MLFPELPQNATIWIPLVAEYLSMTVRDAVYEIFHRVRRRDRNRERHCGYKHARSILFTCIVSS